MAYMIYWPIRPIGPIIRHHIFMEHVGKGLGGFALDVSRMVGCIEVSRASRNRAPGTSIIVPYSWKAKNTDQLESNPGT